MSDQEVKVENENDATQSEVKSEVKSEIPDDDELKRVLLEILGKADLEAITKKTVRRSLEGKLGLYAPPHISHSCPPLLWIFFLCARLVWSARSD